MKQLYYKGISLFNALKNKIVFYPTVFAVIGIFLAILMIYLEDEGISKYLLDTLPVLVVENGDTAMAVLSAIITGLISMMVFSFSMVMLLLSQASSDYSPRLLPGLISNRSHQMILGIYLGTILYCIFILFAIEPAEDKFQIPGFSVLLGILFTVICIYAFIFFIHNISENIQITKILDTIYLTAKNNLNALIRAEEDREIPFPQTTDWHEYHIEKSGYLQDFSINNLLEICKEEDIKIHILPVKGVFVLKGIPLFRSSREVNKKTVEKILSNFNFTRGELVSANYVLAFKQITEIVVKGMSPGVNDPGTALNGVDYLSELLALRLQKKDHDIIHEDGEIYLKFNSVNFDELLYFVMASIRTYCKHDIVLIQKLLLMFHYLKMHCGKDTNHLEAITLEAQNLIQDAKQSLKNKRDIQKVMEMAEKMDIYIFE